MDPHSFIAKWTRADRTERRIYKEMEAEERARLGLPPKSDS